VTFQNTKTKFVVPVIASILILGVMVPSMLLDDAFAKKADKVTICHIPQGNPDNPQTIEVSENAVPAHLAHGDSLGTCEAGPINVVFEENFDNGLVGWTESVCIRNDPTRQTCEIGQATELNNAPPNNLSPHSLPNWGFVQVNDVAHPSPPGSPEVRFQKTFNVIDEDDYDVSAWLGTKDCGGCNISTRLYIDGNLIFEEIGIGPSLAGREGELREFFRQTVIHLTAGTHDVEMGMFSTVANAGQFRASFDDIQIEH